MNSLVKNYFIIFITMMILSACSSSTRYSRSMDDGKDNESRQNNTIETEQGIASYYADDFNGKRTANGEIYDMNELTAAHPSYPFNTILKVTNLQNGKSVEVRINDRMPQFKGRTIDLSLAAAKKIDMISAGIQKVKIEVVKWGS